MTSYFSPELFRFDEAITDPSLKSSGEIGGALDIFVALARRQKTELIGGSKNIEFPEFGPMRQLGHLLAHTAISGQVEAAEAIGMFWINWHQNMDNTLISQAYNTLSAEGRLDLVRPIFALMHGLCERVWRARNERTDVSHFLPSSQIFDANALPDPRLLPKKIQKHILSPLNQGDIGAGAWWMLCNSLSKQVAPENVRPSPETLKVVNDVMTSIPDAAPAAAAAVLNTSKYWQDGSIWDNPEWIRQLDILMKPLIDSEACTVLRELSDLPVLETTQDIRDGMAQKRLIRVTRMAQTLIDNHPNNTLEDWLWKPTPMVSTSSRQGWAAMRDQIAEHGFEPGKGEMVVRRISDMAQTYENIASWVGPQRGVEMSEQSRRKLNEIVQYTSMRGLNLPVLQSTIDFSALTEKLRNTPATDAEAKLIPTSRRKGNGRL